MQIKLDTAAMNALFPEGTTARIELQSAVIASLAGRFIKPSTEVKEMLEVHRKQAVNDVLKEIGFTFGYNGSITLTEMAKSNIKEQASIKVYYLIGDLIKQATDKYITQIADRVNTAMDRMTDDMIKKVVSDKLAAAIATIK